MTQMDEPSLLDYLKEKYSLRRLCKGREASLSVEEKQPLPPEEPEDRSPLLSSFPWRSIGGMIFALVGQRFFEPGTDLPALGIGFYLLAVVLLLLALIKKEWVLKPIQADIEGQVALSYRRTPFLILIPLILVTFFSFSGNQFSTINLFLWIATFAVALASFWIPTGRTAHCWANFKEQVTGILHGGRLQLKLNWWNVLLVAVFLFSAWFHLKQLSSVPLDMTSDHTEKLLDVNEVLKGNLSIFFPRNGGREPIEFYLVAGMVKYLGMEMGFTVLKLSMALAFLFSLYYVYQLGKEVGNRWTGLFTMLLIGIASWTNILARTGMRLVLTPVFVAPLLFYLIRGLRRASRNDLVLAGIFLGLGMLGYSAFRVVPLVVLLVFIVYFFHHNSREKGKGLIGGFGVIVLFSMIAALPLLRYATQYPQTFSYRMVTRMTSAEQAVQGSVILIFLQNMIKAFAMPFWRDGNTWVLSVTNRPALDVVTAALYVLGVVLLIIAWFRQHKWQYAALIVSIPILMLPSILAIAFPEENPSLSRAGGAVIPILLVAAIALESLLSSLWQNARKSGGRFLAGILAGGLLLVSAAQNYDLVFQQYNLQYQNATWNTAQMGKIARAYIESIGSPDTVWVVAVPYWVDTRLVAINAGYVGRDYQIWPDDLAGTLSETRTKLFFVKVDDAAGMAKLTQLYPNGFSEYHASQAPGRDFYTYLVPPTATGVFSP